NLRQPSLAIKRIVNEALLFNRGGDSLLEMIASNELAIIVKRDSEARRDLDAWQPCMYYLAEICRLGAESNRIARALMREICKLVILEIGARRDQIASFDPFPIARVYFASVRGRKTVTVFANLEPNVFSFELPEEFVGVPDRRIRNRPGFRQHIDVRERRRRLGHDDSRQRRQM